MRCTHTCHNQPHCGLCFEDYGNYLPPTHTHPPNFYLSGFPGGASGKEPTCQSRRGKRHGFDPWVGKILWRRKWQPTPVFLLKNPTDRGAWLATGGRKGSDLLNWEFKKVTLIPCPSGAHVFILSHFSRVQLFVTLRTIARQAPLSMDSPGKNTGVGCHILSYSRGFS